MAAPLRGRPGERYRPPLHFLVLFFVWRPVLFRLCSFRSVRRRFCAPAGALSLASGSLSCVWRSLRIRSLAILRDSGLPPPPPRAAVGPRRVCSIRLPRPPILPPFFGHRLAIFVSCLVRPRRRYAAAGESGGGRFGGGVAGLLVGRSACARFAAASRALTAVSRGCRRAAGPDSGHSPPAPPLASCPFSFLSSFLLPIQNYKYAPRAFLLAFAMLSKNRNAPSFVWGTWKDGFDPRAFSSTVFCPQSKTINMRPAPFY